MIRTGLMSIFWQPKLAKQHPPTVIIVTSRQKTASGTFQRRSATIFLASLVFTDHFRLCQCELCKSCREVVCVQVSAPTPFTDDAHLKGTSSHVQPPRGRAASVLWSGWHGDVLCGARLLDASRSSFRHSFERVFRSHCNWQACKRDLVRPTRSN